MPTLQEVMQQAKTLPLTDQVTLGEFLLKQAKHDSQNTNGAAVKIDEKAFDRPDMVRNLEREWLQQNWREYLGQWVAIEGDKLISSSNDGKIVFAAARAAGIRVPFVIHVQDPTLPQMGGW